ncbi:FHA domain-containing protein [Agromyces sp. PvR057]|uniref:FHA domain-containing protein n=1 Tax=Agromyces sp. PvR057 TaxID=3156403 RepID=UPI000E224EB0
MATYTTDPSGAHLAAVRGGVVLMLPVASAGLIVDLWPRLVEADPVRSVLDRLTVDGLSSTPSFGLVVRADDAEAVRVVVRGGFSVRLGAELVTGEGVSTWVERSVEGSEVEVVATDAAARPAAVTLPIIEGVVFAASVGSDAVEAVAAVPEAVVAVASAAKPEAESAPAPSAPAPEPERPDAAASPAPAPVPPVAPAAWAPPVIGHTASTISGPPPAETPARAYDAIDDSTIVSPVGGASAATIRPSASSSAGSEQTIVPLGDTLTGDHDGLTVVGGDVQRLRAERDARRAEQSASGEQGRPAASAAVASPRLSLRMPDGSLEPVTHEVLLGRAPSVSQVSGGRLPRVVAIGAGDQDISRTHVRVTVEGDTVVITDLHSRNGTHVAQPGKPPVRLRAGEPTPVLVGTVVDLGGGWTIQVVAS